MTEVLEFKDVAQEVKGAMNDGRLKLSRQGVVFKNNKTGKIEQVQATDLEVASWIQVARGHELKLFQKNGTVFKFDGFKETDFDRLSSFIKKNYEISLEEKELSVKGWNWGQPNFVGSEMSFEVNSKSCFSIPLGNVAHATKSKNEVVLEFHQNDDSEVSLMEMRFFIPPTDSEVDRVQQFHESVLAKADVIQAIGDAIVKLEQIACLTPRGRYDIKLYPTFMQFHGKTFDYKIPYTTVLRIFLLPHKDQRQVFFVISVDPPIVQGQTRYHFLILSLNKEEDLTLNLNLTEEEMTEKYDGRLQQEMAGPYHEIVSRLMKALIGTKITVPGSFKGPSGSQAITCSYKSNSGYLYPLERGFIYVHKPPIHIRFDEVTCVNFARGTGSSRYFDYEIETRNGNVYVFSSIDKDEYGPLFDFVKNKKLRMKNRNMKDDTVNYDEIFGSDDEDEHDAYLVQVKAEGREKDDDYVMAEEDDDDDEDDDDFNPLESASSCAEEYDSNVSTSNSSDSEEEGDSQNAEEADEVEEGELTSETKKRKKKKEKKESKPKKVRKVSDKPRKPRKKKVKDENKPKRAQSAYMLWLNAHREEIKTKYPGISITDLSKKAGEMWRNLDDKSKWNKMYLVEKEKYDEAMIVYKRELAEKGSASSDDEEDNKPLKKKKSKSKESKASAASSGSPMKKPGSGSNYKSAEFVESSSDDDDDGNEKSESDDAASGKSDSEKEEVKSSEEEEKEEEDDADEEMDDDDDD
ncbi:FACT complex subunit SSRP1-like isoform X2 [Anneissia japonica]|uniref:FACT complex subunit SSRP1-like isoform X1 n=1 Tax=Anneissia japonica TaxID=1529436 RepID=UPI001425B8DF|nr:FACT complex subunit SSRP1-like isoform X1 [Anneissia japonica]XP_033119363.1 FACT complex subunit SSRP1-like isoform X2 [Anneissia japonica]